MDSVAIDYELQTTLQKLEKNELLDYVSGVIQQHYLTKKNKYLPIEFEDAYKIKQILKTCQLEEEIVLNEKQSVKLLGEIAEVGEEGYCCSLITGKNNNVCLIPNCDSPLVLGVYNLNLKSRIKSACIYMQRWGSVLEFVDLSDCIEDNETIYIVNKISKIGQDGYIYRLYRNIENNKDILERKERLITEFDGKIINYLNEEWIVINEIKKQDLYNKEKATTILHDFIQDFIRYVFTIDSIVKKY